MKENRWLSLVFALFLPLLAAEEPVPHRQDRPPNRPFSPEEALRRMVVPEGFVVELVASEPEIVNPVAMAFDDRGRIWITESVEYPRREAGPGRDRVRVLEDSDLDGRADRFTVFAEGLNIPTGIALGHGGVWVLNAPDLLFLEEREGREAGRRVVVTGFGRADTHELPSTLTWGPDGWLYGLNGVFNPSRIVSEGREHRFTCALWRVHPRTGRFEVFAEGTSNPWGLAWDLEGSAIVSACHWARDHIFHFVETGYYQRQAGPYPPFTMKLGSISTHGHQKTAFCGLAFLDSDAYPEPYRGKLYFGNIHGGCINSDRLERDGSTYLSQAEPDFLAANDAWFMPVAQKVGPDGCLYVLDWYDRYHCYQDANRDSGGIDRLKGRLYRVRHRGSPPHGSPGARFDLSREGDERLVERLGSPNVFFREAAQRILAERSAPETRRTLERLVLDGAAARKARLHALWALLGMGDLEPGFHERLLSHPDAGLRAWAARAAGNQRKVDARVRAGVAALARDPAPDVLLQAAIALRKVEGLDPHPLPLLVEVLQACGEDKLIPSIVWSNLHPLLEEEAERFVGLVERAGESAAPALVRLLPRALDRMLLSRDPDLGAARALLGILIQRGGEGVGQGLEALSRRMEGASGPEREALSAELRPVVERALSAGAGTSLELATAALGARLGLGAGDPAAVRARFLSDGQPPKARLDALEALVALRDASLPEVLEKAMASAPPGLLGRSFAVLGKADDPRIGERVLAALPGLDPEVQPLAVDLLLTREPWARKLLDAVIGGRLPRSTLHLNHLRKILDSNDREAVWAVEKVWGSVRAERSPERERVVAEVAGKLRRSPGEPLAGEKVFRKLCAQCHAIHGEGKNVGPDLTGNGRATFEGLVSSVFDPSLVVGPGYETTTVVTRDGRNLTGIAVEKGERKVVIRMQGGEEVEVARGNVKYLFQQKLSLMPEGLEGILDPREIADLFAFLCQDRHPRDPESRPIPGAPVPLLPKDGRGAGRR